MTVELCAAQHLRAIVSESTYWTVDDEGRTIKRVGQEAGDPDGYYCTNCEEQFVPEQQKYNHYAWEDALAHIEDREQENNK